MLVLIVAIFIAGFWVAAHRDSGPFPKTVRTKVSFALYYPAKLSAGLQVDKSSMSATSQVVTYQVTDKASSSHFVVSIQPEPAGFDFQSFYEQFFNPDKFSTEIGDVEVGNVSVNLMSSIRTKEGCWIIINTTNQQAKPKLVELTRSLALVKN
ncbi:MAG TPA: hypothetical protein VL737_01035 [Candidatus Pristimantibacillus sp.]|nr:hypothetical protein [Candidatus Pristimantibacillus sp.]